MKRSWDIIKLILTIAESHTDKEIKKEEYLRRFMNREPGEDSDYEQLLTYNFKLLKEEGYISGGTHYELAIGRLSWKGHNLLDDIREATMYESARG
ncbi:DUF2513 domain-containing protein [Pseudomonas sp. UBA2522]|uniref:DUF2513 domain-containing protein n=1 Tax=Pseudomonas sp. UBA2522 TaxID=1947309 RepID=UPI002579EB26|nr:DUF2513 domain-containing protein [Pseudomonas sp. UBA2522]